MVIKARKLSKKKRFLILTDSPRIFYVDPKKMEFKVRKKHHMAESSGRSSLERRGEEVERYRKGRRRLAHNYCNKHFFQSNL
jgi:hypothetical protein